MKYGIVAFPSKKLQDLANTYRKRYDPHYAKITPHMTLKDSFDATEDDIQSIVKQLDDIAAKHAPLNIHASRISSFFPTTNAIYFRIEPTEQLQAFDRVLEEQIPFGDSKRVLVPHSTTTRKRQTQNMIDIFGQLGMSAVDEHDSIDFYFIFYTNWKMGHGQHMKHSD
ncbi:Putative phosphoesterase OS=Lysinibacillus sphaericus OX=1421 GN=yjcG PE=3 SV=1 [Lysinibacillus sphaericus]